ncbi:hypothetical protein TSAR_016291 [Trichomalopsis sarcophagae]|uniref:Uncharacterized protein n=1 Tax=Trichomalopsis sarcophagae TaxID=543379 RepID=A0A232EKE0_9HYME|nr:hypothetical protein TSAR_016291 [Trichomalopsis sarcophagae]
MCTTFSLRFNISDQALLMLLSMFQFCAGPEFSSLNLSKHMMAKCFSSQNENLPLLLYFLLGKNYFFKNRKQTNKKIKAFRKLFFDNCLAYQIKTLFSNQEILDDILKNIASNNNEFKGLIQEEILAEFDHNKNENEYILTFNCNTDGAPLTKTYQIKTLFSNQEILDDILKNIASNNNELKDSIQEEILAEFDHNKKK